MLLSVELPPSLQELRRFLDYDFIIAHHYLTDSEYKAVYAGKNNQSILDNGAFETGSSTDLQSYLSIIKETHPRIIVLPDVVDDKNDTLHNCSEFLNSDIMQDPDVRSAEFMGVLQGTSIKDYLDCMNFYISNVPELTTIGVPYHQFYRPKLLTKYIHDICKNHNLNIHILGLPNPFEVFELKKFPKVVSIDTSLPVVSGINNLAFTNHAWISAPLEISPEEPYTTEQQFCIIHNILTLKHWCH